MTELVETRLQSTSPPPMDYRFTAVAAAPDSTTAAARNSDPRPLDNDGNTIASNSDDTPPVPVVPTRNTGKIGNG